MPATAAPAVPLSGVEALKDQVEAKPKAKHRAWMPSG